MIDRSKTSSNDRGVGKLTILVFGTIIAVTLYTAYRVVPFFYYFYEMQTQVHAVSRVASELTDDEIRKRLLERIKELGIPAKPEALVLNRYENKLRVMLKYEEEFFITYDGKDHTIRVFPFKIDVTTKY